MEDHRAKPLSAGPPTEDDSGSARILTWPDPPTSEYREAFRRAFSGIGHRLSRLMREHAEAYGIYQTLVALEPASRRVMVRNSRRFHRLAVCELMLGESLRVAIDSPEEARELADLAVEVAGRLDEPELLGGIRQDCLARGWAYLGNAERLLGRLAEAAAGFGTAKRHLADGTGDPLEAAHLLQLEAFLAADRDQLLRAEQLLERALSLYCGSDHVHLGSRVLVHRASISFARGDLKAAIRLCRNALDSIDGRSDRPLALVARRMLVRYLTEAGEYRSALRLLFETRAFDEGSRGSWASWARRWLTGKIAQRERRTDEALRTFEQCRDGFLACGDVHGAARATLDLVGLILRDEQRLDLQRLADSLAPLIDEPELEPGTAAALSELREEACRRSVSPDLLARVHELLGEGENDTHLYFALTS